MSDKMILTCFIITAIIGLIVFIKLKSMFVLDYAVTAGFLIFAMTLVMANKNEIEAITTERGKVQEVVQEKDDIKIIKDSYTGEIYIDIDGEISKIYNSDGEPIINK